MTLRRAATTTVSLLLSFVRYGAAAEGRRIVPALLFENHGQVAPSVRFVLKNEGINAYFRDDEVQFLTGSSPIRLRFAGGSAAVRPIALDPNPGRLNFLTGNNPAQWLTNLQLLSGLVYRGVYPGIDVRWLVRDSQAKSEFVLAPGADAATIQLHYSGMSAMEIEASGSLQLRAEGGTMREHTPEAYTVEHGIHNPVQVAFHLGHHGDVGFYVGPYDHNLVLVIDPVLSYSTFLSGSGHDTASSVAVDASGSVYVAGWAESQNFPVTGGLRRGSGLDGFVAKFNSSNTLVYCTYIGGANEDRITGIAVDGSNSAVVTGYTASPDMPFVSALQPTLRGTRNAFIAKLNSQGTALQFGTYLGGSGADTAAGIALDRTGNIYVAGATTSADFPTAHAFRSAKSGPQNAFVSKLDFSGATLIYMDAANAIAVDAAGEAFVAGSTSSGDFPVVGPLFRSTIPGQQSAFVTKVSANGAGLIYSTFLGGSRGNMTTPEIATAVAVDAAGAAYVAGVTSSIDFPVVKPYLVLTDGGTHGFIGKLNPVGSALVFSTYFGGSGRDWPLGIAVNSAGSIYVCGYTSSTDLPVPSAIQASNAGLYDGFLARFTANGALVFGTYLGGGAIDSVNALALDPSGNILLAGHTMSYNFPVVSPYQGANTSSYAAFLAKVSDADLCFFDGVRDLVWMNNATRQVTFNCFGGPGGATVTGSNYLFTASGWHVAAVADFDGNGTPDLVWVNDQTNEVHVLYYGGTGGTSVIGFNVLYLPGFTSGWHIVGAGDFNSDGVPDLVWQNDTTGQVNVNYFGGAGGATLIGYNVLYPPGSASGWRAAAIADFNGDGVPDILWQNNTTAQVNVNYFGGLGGASLLGANVLYPPGFASGWHAVAALDFDNNFTPDVVWQNDTTGQVNVNYFGGPGGATLLGFNVLYGAGSIAGWSVVN